MKFFFFSSLFSLLFSNINDQYNSLIHQKLSFSINSPVSPSLFSYSSPNDCKVFCGSTHFSNASIEKTESNLSSSIYFSDCFYALNHFSEDNSYIYMKNYVRNWTQDILNHYEGKPSFNQKNHLSISYDVSCFSYTNDYLYKGVDKILSIETSCSGLTPVWFATRNKDDINIFSNILANSHSNSSTFSLPIEDWIITTDPIRSYINGFKYLISLPNSSLIKIYIPSKLSDKIIVKLFSMDKICTPKSQDNYSEEDIMIHLNKMINIQYSDKEKSQTKFEKQINLSLDFFLLDEFLKFNYSSSYMYLNQDISYIIKEEILYDMTNIEKKFNNSKFSSISLYRMSHFYIYSLIKDQNLSFHFPLDFLKEGRVDQSILNYSSPIIPLPLKELIYFINNDNYNLESYKFGPPLIYSSNNKSEDRKNNINYVIKPINFFSDIIFTDDKEEYRDQPIFLIDLQNNFSIFITYILEAWKRCYIYKPEEAENLFNSYHSNIYFSNTWKYLKSFSTLKVSIEQVICSYTDRKIIYPHSILLNSISPSQYINNVGSIVQVKYDKFLFFPSYIDLALESLSNYFSNTILFFYFENSKPISIYFSQISYALSPLISSNPFYFNLEYLKVIYDFSKKDLFSVKNSVSLLKYGAIKYETLLFNNFIHQFIEIDRYIKLNYYKNDSHHFKIYLVTVKKDEERLFMRYLLSFLSTQKKNNIEIPLIIFSECDLSKYQVIFPFKYIQIKEELIENSKYYFNYNSFLLTKFYLLNYLFFFGYSPIITDIRFSWEDNINKISNFLTKNNNLLIRDASIHSSFMLNDKYLSTVLVDDQIPDFSFYLIKKCSFSLNYNLNFLNEPFNCLESEYFNNLLYNNSHYIKSRINNSDYLFYYDNNISNSIYFLQLFIIFSYHRYNIFSLKENIFFPFSQFNELYLKKSESSTTLKFILDSSYSVYSSSINQYFENNKILSPYFGEIILNPIFKIEILPNPSQSYNTKSLVSFFPPYFFSSSLGSFTFPIEPNSNLEFINNYRSFALPFIISEKSLEELIYLYNQYLKPIKIFNIKVINDYTYQQQLLPLNSHQEFKDNKEANQKENINVFFHHYHDDFSTLFPTTTHTNISSVHTQLSIDTIGVHSLQTFSNLLSYQVNLFESQTFKFLNKIKKYNNIINLIKTSYHLSFFLNQSTVDPSLSNINYPNFLSNLREKLSFSYKEFGSELKLDNFGDDYSLTKKKEVLFRSNSNNDEIQMLNKVPLSKLLNDVDSIEKIDEEIFEIIENKENSIFYSYTIKIFAYTRPLLLQNLIESLKKSYSIFLKYKIIKDKEMKGGKIKNVIQYHLHDASNYELIRYPIRLHIIIDSLKNSTKYEDYLLHQETIRVAKTIEWPFGELKLTFHKFNRGLKKNWLTHWKVKDVYRVMEFKRNPTNSLINNIQIIENVTNTSNFENCYVLRFIGEFGDYDHKIDSLAYHKFDPLRSLEHHSHNPDVKNNHFHLHPIEHHEFSVTLEDDLEISPYYFIFLDNNINKYYFSKDKTGEERKSIFISRLLQEDIGLELDHRLNKLKNISFEDSLKVINFPSEFDILPNTFIRKVQELIDFNCSSSSNHFNEVISYFYANKNKKNNIFQDIEKHIHQFKIDDFSHYSSYFSGIPILNQFSSQKFYDLFFHSYVLNRNIPKVQLTSSLSSWGPLLTPLVWNNFIKYVNLMEKVEEIESNIYQLINNYRNLLIKLLSICEKRRYNDKEMLYKYSSSNNIIDVENINYKNLYLVPLNNSTYQFLMQPRKNSKLRYVKNSYNTSTIWTNIYIDFSATFSLKTLNFGFYNNYFLINNFMPDGENVNSFTYINGNVQLISSNLFYDALTLLKNSCFYSKINDTISLSLDWDNSFYSIISSSEIPLSLSNFSPIEFFYKSLIFSYKYNINLFHFYSFFFNLPSLDILSHYQYDFSQLRIGHVGTFGTLSNFDKDRELNWSIRMEKKRYMFHLQLFYSFFSNNLHLHSIINSSPNFLAHLISIIEIEIYPLNLIFFEPHPIIPFVKPDIEIVTVDIQDSDWKNYSDYLEKQELIKISNWKAIPSSFYSDVIILNLPFGLYKNNSEKVILEGYQEYDEFLLKQRYIFKKLNFPPRCIVFDGSHSLGPHNFFLPMEIINENSWQWPSELQSDDQRMKGVIESLEYILLFELFDREPLRVSSIYW